MGGRLATLVQKAEDEVVVFDKLLGVGGLTIFKVGEFAVGVKAANDTKFVVGLAQNKINRCRFFRLDSEELAVGQSSTVFKACACGEDIHAFVQRRWLLEC